jgi:4-hydroxy-3-polyprenylbenzoate decarboxylase
MTKKIRGIEYLREELTPSGETHPRYPEERHPQDSTRTPVEKNANVRRWLIGVSGASGIQYALRLLDLLTIAGPHDQKIELHVVFSEAALRVLQDECGLALSQSRLTPQTLLGEERQNIYFYNPRDIGALPASGSFLAEGMVIVPCSMSSLGAIAHGCGHNLLHRMADVTLKESRKLIIVPRETPLHVIHLENLLTLARLGAQIVPAMPGFYHCPQTVTDIVDMLAMKIMDAMHIANSASRRWGETRVDKTAVQARLIAFPKEAVCDVSE